MGLLGYIKRMNKKAMMEKVRSIAARAGRSRPAVFCDMVLCGLRYGAGYMDYDLFEKLRGLRMELAKKDRVPPYLVFTDKTLTQMCQLRPKSKEEMLMVSGVGENKFRKYGEAFLALLNEERQD